MINSLIVHLDETRKSLIREITSLNYTQFNRRADIDSWSIAQICHHLVLGEQATIKAIQ